ncbi:MAG: hypothetical protein AAF962_18260 [Actinomycetota bacterium]
MEHSISAVGRTSLDRPAAPASGVVCETSRFAVFASCPMCDGDMAPEHAHFRCVSCGWRDSCCD